MSKPLYRLAGAEAGVVAGEELDRVRHLVRLGEPAQRHALPPLAHLAVVGNALGRHVHVHDLLDALAFDRAGAHAVRADARVGELERQRLRQPDQRPLRGLFRWHGLSASPLWSSEKHTIQKVFNDFRRVQEY